MSFRVLVIDRPANAQIMRGALINAGATEVALTGDSEGALVTLQNERFDMVYCDEASHPLNPVAFAKKLRRDDKTKNPDIVLIVIAGHASTRHVELARDSGANDLVVRPISAKTLQRKIKATLLSPSTLVRTESFEGPDRRRRGERRLPENATVEPPEGERRTNNSRRAGDKRPEENPAQ